MEQFIRTLRELEYTGKYNNKREQEKFTAAIANQLQCGPFWYADLTKPFSDYLLDAFDNKKFLPSVYRNYGEDESGTWRKKSDERIILRRGNRQLDFYKNQESLDGTITTLSKILRQRYRIPKDSPVHIHLDHEHLGQLPEEEFITLWKNIASKKLPTQRNNHKHYTVEENVQHNRTRSHYNYVDDCKSIYLVYRDPEDAMKFFTEETKLPVPDPVEKAHYVFGSGKRSKRY